MATRRMSSSKTSGPSSFSRSIRTKLLRIYPTVSAIRPFGSPVTTTTHPRRIKARPGPSPQSSAGLPGGGNTTSELARRVLKPEEILTLPRGRGPYHSSQHAARPGEAGAILRRKPSSVGSGTGKRRGLGLAAGVLSMLALAASVLFAMFVNRLSFPVLGPACRGRTGAGHAAVDGRRHGACTRYSQNWSPGHRRNEPSLFPELAPRPTRRRADGSGGRPTSTN